MVKRTAEEALRRLASQFPVIGITGPRQSGKSTLAKAVFPDKKYVTFDDRTMRDLAASNPNDFIMAFPAGAVIDEAQKVPEIFDAIKLHVDREHSAPGTFIVTGSSQLRLKANMTDSLAGRAAFFEAAAIFYSRVTDGWCAAGQSVYADFFGSISAPL